MIADSFNSRTLATMEVALDRACRLLHSGAEQHKTRRYIASKILACARQGDVSLDGLYRSRTNGGRRNLRTQGFVIRRCSDACRGR